MIEIINKYYEPELGQVRVVMLEDELMKIEQKLYDIEDFIESFDYDSLTDKEKVKFETIKITIKLIIDGTVKMARD